MLSVSENFSAESVFILQNKMRPFLKQGKCIYVGYSFFFIKHS